MNKITEQDKHAFKEYKEKFDMGPMVTHEVFVNGVKQAISLPAQTCRALGPESDEDISMYAEDKA